MPSPSFSNPVTLLCKVALVSGVSKCTSTVLLIDKSVSRFLLAILENDRGNDDENSIDTNYTERTGENEIEEVVGFCREWANATELGGGDEGVGTGGIDDERGGGGVCVAAAVELVIIRYLCAST
jgi:hypothetical protein